MASIKVRVGVFSPPKKFNPKKLVERLNSLQSFYQFAYLGTSQNVGPSDVAKRHYSTNQLTRVFSSVYLPDASYGYDLMLTDARIEGDYFTQIIGRLGIISSADADLAIEKAGKSVEKYYAYNMIETLLWLQYDCEHDADREDTGCLFDSCFETRSNIVLGLQRSTICDDCEHLLNAKNAPSEQIDSARSILRWIARPSSANYAKWGLSAGLLIAGLLLIVFPPVAAFQYVGIAMMTLSGWIASAPGSIWQRRR